MIIKEMIKKKIIISIVAVVTMLILILTGCNNSNQIPAIDDTNSGKISDGTYDLTVDLTGGSGKATIKSPAKATVSNGEIIVDIEWSSSNYDYMIVDGKKYLPVNDSGNSIFSIPIDSMNCSIDIVADTVAMSTPHEIEYTITFSMDGDEASQDVNQNSLDENIDLLDSGNVENYKAVTRWLESQKGYEKVNLKYAEKFSIYKFDENFYIIEIDKSDYYFVADNKDKIPNDLPECVTYIERPLDKICVVSTASMDYFLTLDAMDAVAFTSFNRADVSNEELARLMDSESIRYSGKYSAPDYELLLSGGCSLVIENTMITHSEEVLNQFNKLKINTMIDYSSHESSPLGRMEWIKLYGVLTGKEEIAERIFEEKKESLLDKYNDTGKTVAYFYITNNGGVVVRKNQDYIATLIQMAGGKYILEGDSRYDGIGTITIQKEAFFESVMNCDYLIYNSTIVGELTNLDNLVKKCEVLKNTKAFKQGNVYCTTDNLYQSVMELPGIAKDINAVLLGEGSTKYLFRLE